MVCTEVEVLYCKTKVMMPVLQSLYTQNYQNHSFQKKSTLTLSFVSKIKNLLIKFSLIKKLFGIIFSVQNFLYTLKFEI